VPGAIGSEHRTTLWGHARRPLSSPGGKTRPAPRQTAARIQETRSTDSSVLPADWLPIKASLLQAATAVTDTRELRQTFKL
jgi:hypothetical protein